MSGQNKPTKIELIINAMKNYSTATATIESASGHMRLVVDGVTIKRAGSAEELMNYARVNRIRVEAGDGKTPYPINEN
jgi:hypothetical protein